MSFVFLSGDRYNQRFALCYGTVVLSVLSVFCNAGVLWPNGWINMPLSTEVGLGPGDILLDGHPAPTTERAQQPPLFGPWLFLPVSIVAKRSPISATAELLLIFVWVVELFVFPYKSIHVVETDTHSLNYLACFVILTLDVSSGF